MSKRQQLLFFLILLSAATLRMINIDHAQTMVFDEVHYIPAAEVIGGLRDNPNPTIWKDVPVLRDSPDPNIVHPPGAKLIILAGIKLFGSRPIGWRFWSWCFGIGSLLLVFSFGKRFFGTYDDALAVMFLVSFDCLHILHSRLAMIDMFLTFFVILLFYLVCFAQPGKDRKWLAIGLTIALGTSIKYVFAVWALGGLVLILLKDRKEWRKSLPYVTYAGLVSLCVYSLWAFFYVTPEHGFGDWLSLHLEAVQRTTGILEYHKYGSHPAQWLFNSKATLYAYSATSGMVKSLVGVGNPVLWTAFLAAMFYAVHRSIQSKNLEKEFFFLVFLIIYVPLYFLIWRRQGYLYYMLPAVLPMAFMVWQMVRLVRSKVVKGGFFFLVFFATMLLSPMLTYEPVPQKWYQWVALILDLEG